MLGNEPPAQPQGNASKTSEATQTYRGCRLCPTGLSVLGRAPRYINSRWMVVEREEEPKTLIVSILHLTPEEMLSQRDVKLLGYARDFCGSSAIKIADPTLLRCGPPHDETCPEGHLHFKVLPRKEVRDDDPTILKL